MRRQLAARRDLPRFAFIVFFFFFFFSLALFESGGEEMILRPAMSRHNILYTPRIPANTQAHTLKYVHYRGITIDLQDCLVKQASIFMPERREAKGKIKIWRRMLREGRAAKNIPGVLPLLNDPKGFYLLPTVCFLVFLASPCLPCPLSRL